MVLSVRILAHAIQHTLRISLPAVAHFQRGTLTRQECDEKLLSWSRHLLDRALVRLVVSGREHVQSAQPPFIVISNHQSLYDIPVWFQALPFSVRMAAKKELFSVPIWGRAMKAAGFVRIDRKDKHSAYQALTVAGQQMRTQGISLVIAPEGTRSKDGQLLPFRNGAFVLSKATGFPIVPMAIVGTMQVHKSGDLVVHTDQEVRAHILAPLFPTDYETVDELREAGRTAIQRELERISSLRWAVADEVQSQKA